MNPASEYTAIGKLNVKKTILLNRLIFTIPFFPTARKSLTINILRHTVLYVFLISKIYNLLQLLLFSWQKWGDRSGSGLKKTLVVYILKVYKDRVLLKRLVYTLVIESWKSMERP